MTKQVATVASKESLALLENSFPVEQGFTRAFIPRLGMFSQDVTEGKGKAMKVITEAGTFYTEVQSDETDEDGKKLWDKTELGSTIEGIIIFQRKQLKFYDESNETFTSSPIYDTDEDIIPLFCNKSEVARGTAKELKTRPEYQFEKDGKIRSKLEENKILYVIYEGELYQLGLRGTSMYAYKDYAKKMGNNPSTVVTSFSSESKEKGTIAWNQMTFTSVGTLTQEQADLALEKRSEIMAAIREEKSYFAAQTPKVETTNNIDKF